MDAPGRRRPAPLAILLFGAAVGLLAGMVWAVATPTGWTATTSVYVEQGIRAVQDQQRSAGFEQTAADSYAGVGTSPLVLQPVARELGVEVASLQRRVSVEREPGTVVLRVRAQDPSADRAAVVANAVAARLVSTVSTLTPVEAGRAPDVHLTVVDRAVAGRATRDSGLADVLAGLLGGTAATALALLVAWLWRRRPPAGGGLAAPSML